jgi:hypothetical protein
MMSMKRGECIESLGGEKISMLNKMKLLMARAKKRKKVDIVK